MTRAKCPACHQPLQPGVAHKCPLSQRKNFEWKWAASIIVVLFLRIAAFVYNFGILNQKVEALQEDVREMKKILYQPR